MKNENKKSKVNVRMIAGSGILTAVSIVLQFLEFSIPIVPSFLKFDFSDLPALIGAFAYGPAAGVIISLIKNVVHIPIGATSFVGPLSNFLLAACFTAVAGYIYRLKKTRGNAFIAGAIGAVTMGLFSVVVNYFIIYPLYYSVLGFPENAVLGLYKVVMPSLTSVTDGLIIFNVPFTIVKGLAVVAISMLIYKPLSPILHGKNK
ncbi:MAG: ECF transporter S component [Ruminococcaceae bacterium]|nr:ECF transporter S component [Oscillospiraceae bacterium]